MKQPSGTVKQWRFSNLVTAAVTLPALPLAWLLGISSGGEVLLGSTPVGNLCLFRSLTGLRCPFCGITRSFIATMHLDLGGAFRFHPAGTLALVFFAVTGIWAFVLAFRRKPPLLSSPVYSRWLWWMVIISIVAGLFRGLWGG